MLNNVKFPQTQTTFYPLKGGLDLVTPAIAISPGACFDAQNYEPNPVGGYRRINGYERFDGRPTPSGAGYSVLPITLSGVLNVGDTVTGATSGATGKVLGLFYTNTSLVLGRVTGTFANGEALQVSAVTQATTTSLATQNGAALPSDDADYLLLAANDLRGDIQTVPGSGNIRGGFVYNDINYVFRDNAGGTAGALYKQSAGGWTLVPFGTEIQFTNATAQINAGDTVTGGTSGATATVVRAMLRTGTWTASGAGTLILSGVVGTFQNAEALKVGGVSKATSSSLATAITRAPGGRVETVIGNFSGSVATRYVYGCDGVNIAFEFDGTNYIPIRTGMTVDTPTHIAFHRSHLWLTFNGSLQYSGVNAPYSWTLLTGAGEIGMGDQITAILPQTGNATGASLAVFTASRTATLYGTDSTNFQLIPSIYELGFHANTVQAVSNNTYGLTARGIQSLMTTLNYGDFQYAAVSFFVQPLLASKAGLESASVTLRAKNQYRLFFTDGTGLVVGLTGEKLSGILLVNYPAPVLAMWSGMLSNGQEVCYFGSSDGYVYRDSVGTSFDGTQIEAWIRPAFNNLKSPRVRKQYRRAIFEVSCEGYAQVNVTCDLGYANPDVGPSAVQQDQSMAGAGGYWEQFTWEQFTWDAPVVSSVDLSIDGTDVNIGFLFYSKRAQDAPHTVSGVNLLYTPRRLVRSGS